MSDAPHPKLLYHAALQEKTLVTVSSEAAVPVFSGSTVMLEHCRAPNAGDAK